MSIPEQFGLIQGLLAGRPGYTLAVDGDYTLDIIGNTWVYLPKYFPRDRLHVSSEVGGINFVSVGEGCANIISVNFTAGTNNFVYIGGYNQFPGALSIYVRGSNNVFSSGQGCNINELNVALIGDGRRIIIGDGGLMSFGVDLRTHDQHGIVELGSGNVLNQAKDIHVEPLVWLGKEASVHGGVTLGCGSIIGERAVVTRDVPRLSLAAGIPARITKQELTWVPDWNDGIGATDRILAASALLPEKMPKAGKY